VFLDYRACRAGASGDAGGSYSAAQATRGKTLYTDQCVACHGEMLEGVVGPPLTGDDFMADFGGKSVKELADKIHATMPQQAPGTFERRAVDGF